MSENTLPLKPMRVGLIGCGDIARKAYLSFATQFQNAYEIVACCDARLEVAEALAKDFAISTVYTDVEALLADDSIEAVINLTHPAGHAPINLQALEAGKHVYCEKPFALNLEEGQAVLDAAKANGLKITCAPDTVLGPGTQTARKLIEDEVIGRLLSARLHCACPGHEHWHPNPEFYYKQGGGPLLDLGPYYLSWLIQTLGPIKSVQGRVARGLEEREIRSEPLKGQKIAVEAPTLYVGSLETVSGVIVQMLFSFDHLYGQSSHNLPEVFGTKGTLCATDPNCFDQQPTVNTVYAGDSFEAQSVPYKYPAGRGLGLVDLVDAVRQNREPRCGGELAYHALEVMLAFEESERTEKTVYMKSICEQPPIMPLEGLPGLIFS